MKQGSPRRGEKSLTAEQRLKLQQFFGVTERALFQWLEAGFPLDSPEAMLRWLRNRKTTRSKTVRARMDDPGTLKALREILGQEDPLEPEPEDDDEGGDATTLEGAKLEKLRVETKRLKLALLKDQGEVVSRVSIREAAQQAGSIFTAELDSIIGDLPGQPVRQDAVSIKERLEAWIWGLSTNLHRKLKKA